MDTMHVASSRILIIVAFTVSALSCSGREHSAGGEHRRVILPAGETHEGWYFAAGDQVMIEGTVNGDAYAAGGLVQVDGTINGDLIVAGGQVVITGKVTDDIRAAGGSVECNGPVGKNLSAAGGSMRIGKGAEIGGGLLAAGGNLFVGGRVERHAMIAAGDMSMSGTINGNVNFAGGALSVLNGSTVGGNLRALVDDTSRVEIASGVVRGKVDVSSRETKAAHTILGLSPWRFWWKILWTLSLIATTLVLVLLFRKQITGIGKAILGQPARSFLWGIVGLVAIPILTIILFITVIGIPVGLLLLLLYLWMVYLSQVSLGVVLGQRLFGGEGTWRLFGAFAVGILIVQLLTLVPYLGTILVLVGLLVGLGAILMVVQLEYGLWRKGENGSLAASAAHA